MQLLPVVSVPRHCLKANVLESLAFSSSSHGSFEALLVETVEVQMSESTNAQETLGLFTQWSLNLSPDCFETFKRRICEGLVHVICSASPNVKLFDTQT